MPCEIYAAFKWDCVSLFKVHLEKYDAVLRHFENRHFSDSSGFTSSDMLAKCYFC